MKKFKRYVYFWDTHWTSKFKDFIKKFDDWETFFYCLWDIFDRWQFSYDNFLEIKELHKKWKLEAVLWNHCLFFLFNKLLGIKNKYSDNALKNWWEDFYEKVFSTYSKLYYMNGGLSTDESFIQKAVFFNQQIEDLYLDTAVYMIENFKLCIKDKFNNFLVHGWIPIMPNNGLVWAEVFLEKKYWIKFIEELNDNFINKKNKDINLRVIQLVDGIILKNDYITEKDWEDIIFRNEPRYLSPTWFENELYETDKKIKNRLLKELDDNWLDKIFVWHWWNLNEIKTLKDKNSKYWENLENRIFRLDRSFKHNDNQTYIWYTILDENWNFIEYWEF